MIEGEEIPSITYRFIEEGKNDEFLKWIVCFINIVA